MTRPAVADPDTATTAPETPDAAPTGAEPAPEAQAPVVRRPVDPSSVASARGAIQDTRQAGKRQQTGGVTDEDAHRDDLDADDHSLGGAELLERELGASIIEEIKHD